MLHENFTDSFISALRYARHSQGIFDMLAEVQTGRDGYFVVAALQFQSDRDVCRSPSDPNVVKRIRFASDKAIAESEPRYSHGLAWLLR